MSYQIILSCAQHYKKNPVALGCLFDDSIYTKMWKWWCNEFDYIKDLSWNPNTELYISQEVGIVSLLVETFKIHPYFTEGKKRGEVKYL